MFEKVIRLGISAFAKAMADKSNEEEIKYECINRSRT